MKMHPKDIVTIALALALCAAGFLILNLARGLLADAAFAFVVMVGAAGYVLRFIAAMPLPQAVYRRHHGG